ncbi:hypothetical protein STEG23_011275, partial [Scotinomys teguina]
YIVYNTKYGYHFKEQQHNLNRAPGDCRQLLNFLSFFHSPAGPLMLREHLLCQNVQSHRMVPHSSLEMEWIWMPINVLMVNENEINDIHIHVSIQRAVTRHPKAKPPLLGHDDSWFPSLMTEKAWWQERGAAGHITVVIWKQRSEKKEDRAVIHTARLERLIRRNGNRDTFKDHLVILLRQHICDDDDDDDDDDGDDDDKSTIDLDLRSHIWTFTSITRIAKYTGK